MKGASKLISSAKLLHFCFPDHMMPIDGLNTLMFCYGNTTESKQKYLHIVQFLLDVHRAVDQRQINWAARLDGGWNSSIPKIIDNAIIFRMSGRKKKL
jgi:hypothetical protein